MNAEIERLKSEFTHAIVKTVLQSVHDRLVALDAESPKESALVFAPGAMTIGDIGMAKTPPGYWVSSKTGKPLTSTIATKRPVTAKRRASMKTQGKYLAMLRKLNPRDRAKARALAKKQGAAAAVKRYGG